MDKLRRSPAPVPDVRILSGKAERVVQIAFTLPPVDVGPAPVRLQAAGRSPRSYRRPDALILDDVVQALVCSYDIDGTELDLSCANGVITASGSLTTQTQRLLLEALVAQTHGTVDYVDKITVTKGIRPRDESGSDQDPKAEPPAEGDADCERATQKHPSK